MSETIRLILTIIHVLVCIGIVVSVLMQSGSEGGLSGAIGGGSETFFGKNKGRSVESKLQKITSVLAGCFIVITLILTLS